MTIELADITKAYDGRKVLDGFDLSISDDDQILLEGPGGSGKTTVLRILAGLEKPDGGKITLLGDYKHENFNVGMVFQENRLLEDFSAAENIAITGKYFTENRAREELMKLIPSDKCDIPVNLLDDETKRIVAIVRACVYPSNILLLDEPFRDISEEMRKYVLNYILESAGHKAIVVAQRTTEGLERFKEVKMN